MGGGEETTHGLKKVAWGLMMKTWGLKEHILGLKEPIHFLRKTLYFLKAALDTLPEPIHFPPQKAPWLHPKTGGYGAERGLTTQRASPWGESALRCKVCAPWGAGYVSQW